MSSEEILFVLQAEDGVTSVFDQISSSIDDVANKVSSLDFSGMFDSASNACSDLSNSLDSIAGNDLSNVTAGLGAIGVGAGLSEAIDLADSYNTSWKALDYTFGQAGGSHDELSNAISKVTSATAVSGAESRSYFQSMANLGVTSTDLLSNSLTTLYGRAGQTGQSFDDVQAATQRMVLSGSLSTRMLAKLGTTSKQLADELGMSEEAFEEAFSSATPEQRLEMLTKAMGDTSAGVEILNNSISMQLKELKLSFEGALIPIGQAIIPSISSALQMVTPVISAFAEVLKLPGVGLAVGVIGGLMATVLALGGALKIASLALDGLASGLSLASSIISVVESLLTGLGIGMGVLEAEETALAGTSVAVDAALAGEATSLGITAMSADAAAGAFGILAGAELAAAWPILAIVAAIALLVLAFEKIGEYFGWWDDFGSMIDSIRAGITELWNVFVNSPQVKGTIEDIKNAFNSVMEAIIPLTSAISHAWNMIFNPSGGEGTSDPLRDIVQSMGRFLAVCGDVANAVKPILVPLGQIALIALRIIATGIVAYFKGWVNMFRLIISAIVSFVNKIITLPAKVKQVFNNVKNSITQRLQSAVNSVRNGARNILNNMVNGIRQIPSRVRSFFSQIPSIISSTIGGAVGAAVSLASSVLNAIVSGVQGIADRVFEEFSQIGDKIKQAVGNAVAAASNWATEVKNAVFNILQFHSPGIIQRRVRLEFEDTSEGIGDYVDSARINASRYGAGIISGFNTGYAKPVKAKSTVNEDNGSQTIHFHFDNVNLDSRNLTTNECKQIFINALEGLNEIKSIEVSNSNTNNSNSVGA